MNKILEKNIELRNSWVGFFSVFIVLLVPFLAIYRSPIPSVDLGSFFIIVNLFILFIKGALIQKFDIKEFLLWTVYMSLICVSNLIGPTYDSFQGASYYWLRTLKYFIVIVFMLFLYFRRIFDLKLAIKWLNKLCMLATIFMFAQISLHYILGYNLPGYISAFCYSETYISRAELLSETFSLQGYRPTSLFSEPAHYSSYVILGIVASLFYGKERKDFNRALLLTIGILFSTSGQGIVYALIIWLIWLLPRRESSDLKQVLARLFFLAIGIWLLYSFFNSATGTFILERILGNKHQGNAIEGRSLPYLNLINGNIPFGVKLFGYGYGNVNLGIFYSSWAFNIWCLGIIGTIYCMVIYLFYFKRSRSRFSKICLFLNIVMGVFTTSFMGNYMLLCFSFVLNDYQYKIYSNSILKR